MASVRAPRCKDAADASEHTFEVSGLLLQQRADLDARRVPRAAERNDVLDLRQSQAKPTRLPDEREQPEHIRRIAPVAGRLTARWREDATGLVQPESLAAQTAAYSHLAYQETLRLHEDRIGLTPRGKVKRQTNAPAKGTGALDSSGHGRPFEAPGRRGKSRSATAPPGASERGGLGGPYVTPNTPSLPARART